MPSTTIPPSQPVLSGNRAFDAGAELLRWTKKQLQIADSITTHDDEIRFRLLPEAVRLFEYETPWVIAEAPFCWNLDCWPNGDSPIEIPKKPVLNIESIKYYDTDRVQQTLSTSAYRLDTTRVWPCVWRSDFGVAWPSLASHRVGLIEVCFDAGFQVADDVPEDILLNLMARVARVWHDRGFGDLAGYGPVWESSLAKRRSSRYL